MKTLNLIKLSCILTVVCVIIILNSCSLFDNEKRDCYNIGRELTEEEKNIFPYNVGDSVFFTDGETDYYIYCDRIVDTIYTVSEIEDIDCEGGRNIDDEYIQYISLKTNIPLYDSCTDFGIVSFPGYHYIIIHSFNKVISILRVFRFSINHEALLNIDKTEYEYRIYIDSIEFSDQWFYDVYKLLSYKPNNTIQYHYADACYINKEKGILGFDLIENKKIVIK